MHCLVSSSVPVVEAAGSQVGGWGGGRHEDGEILSSFC